MKKRTRSRKHALGQESVQENDQETEKNFLFLALSWSRECFLEPVFFSGHVRVYLNSYFLFFFYKFPALLCSHIIEKNSKRKKESKKQENTHSSKKKHTRPRKKELAQENTLLAKKASKKRSRNREKLSFFDAFLV